MTDHIELPDGRTMPADEYQRRLDLLSAPFAADELEKLPKQMRGKDDDKGKCERGTRYSADGHYCGGWHARSIHLDYVGHAGITDRLNAVDPLWTWEPMAFTPHGTPLMSDGGMWAKLTVLGVTRIGFGDAAGKTGPNAIKECIGDFLRNAAMRFGVATYLWSKSEAAAAKKIDELEQQEVQQPKASQPAQPTPQQLADKALTDAGTDLEKLQAVRAWATRAEAPKEYLDRVEAAITQAQATQPIEGTLIP
jgi:hypothetical protein